MEKLDSRQKNILKGIIIFIGALVVIYIGTALFFTKHFLVGTKINGINVSNKTVSEVDKLFSDEVNNYTLTLNERNDKEEVITASDISLKYDSTGQITALKESQNAFAWFVNIFRDKKTELTNLISYDDNLLKEKVTNLDCLKKENIVEPVNANLEFSDGNYSVVNEINGTKLDEEKLFAAISNSINNSEQSLTLDDTDAYINPTIKADSKELADAKELMSKYVNTSITYTFGDDSEVVTSDMIAKWMSLDSECNVVFNESKVKKYMYALANKYNTIGTTRLFKTSDGSTISVSGGDYGWQINCGKETDALIEDIKNGQTITKEPIYTQKAISHSSNDIGNSYVEISLTKQHVWLYKNGSLVIESDMASGTYNDPERETHVGTYDINAKQRDTTLGTIEKQGYESPVKFWMPFDEGIGLHDASWREEDPAHPQFGGSYYKYAGSHGCVNLPTAVAKVIYENVEVGTPVIVYK